VLAKAARAAIRLRNHGLVLASLVVGAAIMLPRTSSAAPAGAVPPATVVKAHAGSDPPITFSFNIGGYIGSGTVQGTYEGGGNYLATTGTLTMAANSVGDAGQTYCLIPAAPPPGSVSTSPMGAFFYDDLVTPGANPAFPDIYALLFSNNAAECAAAGYNGGNYNGNDEINIWATDGTPGNYSFYDFAANVGFVITYVTTAGQNDSFSATAATTTYSYSGNGFKLFECATSPSPDCAAPGAGNPYTSTNSVTVGLQLGGPLCGNPGSCSTAPVNVTCSANFVSMTLNDGVNTISTNNTCPANATAWIATDANGNITAWYVDGTAANSQDIHTLNDPQGLIAAACDGCYANIPNAAKGAVQDYGQFSVPDPAQYYGYNLNSAGSFTPGYNGGTTTAGNCSNGQNCSLVPGDTFTILGPNAGAIPPGAVLTEQECVVPADPRGANCGATNGHLPRTLNVSSLPQCKGFGNEVIPDYLCGASGASGTGFALILGNAEQIDTFNGTYGDSELDVEKVPGLAGAATNPTCPKGLPGTPLPAGVPSALGTVGTRSGSLVEEQTPEQTLDGRPFLLEMTSSCEPPRTNHGPGLTLEGIGFKLRTNDPSVKNKLTDAQNMLVFANYKYVNLDIVMLLTKFPTNTPTRKNLQNCINKSQTLLNSGPSHYFCAAEQVYRCDQIVEDQGIPFTQFGPSTSPLRLPDPYGDIVRRLGNLYYTINTRINSQKPNNDWPLTSDPYANLGCPLP
jgi:hypothetical protein